MARPLCELHAHMGGCLRAEDILELVGRREADWAPYERRYRQVYGADSQIREILAAVRAGEPDARDRFRRLFVFGDESAGDFDRFSANFGLIAASFLAHPELAQRLPTSVADEIALAAERIAGDCRRQGIAHCEVRFMLARERPLEVRRGLYRLLLREFVRHSRDGVQLRLAPSLPREEPLQAFRVVQEVALEEHGEALTAVDFCHVEEGHPPTALRAFADELRAFNAAHPQRALALLYHVGESYRDKSLESAVRWCHEAVDVLGAHRLGHAIALGVCPSHHGVHRRRERVCERRDQIAYDLAHAEGLRAHGVGLARDALERESAELAGRDPSATIEHVYDARRLDELPARQAYAISAIARAGAVAEICPTSNRRIAGFTRAEVHQVHRFRECGMPFVVGADDPGILDITLADELAWLHRHARMSRAELDDLVARGWECVSERMSGRVGG
jgi:adenosine deaminase